MQHVALHCQSQEYNSHANNVCTRALDKTVLQIACTHTQGLGPTCLPAASEAPLPRAAVDPGGVAGVPEAQVTAETLQKVLLRLLHGLRLILFLT